MNYPPPHSSSAALHRLGRKAVPALAAALLAWPVLSEAATVTWSGAASSVMTANGNWLGGAAPVLVGAGNVDIASFTGASAPANQPTWTVTGSSSLGGLETGNDYAVTMTLNPNAASTTIDFGSSGITTGSTLLTMTGSNNSARTVRLQVNTNQTWNIGSGGMAVTQSGLATVSLIGSGTLTKAGSGDLTWSGGNGSIAGLQIDSGGVITTSAATRMTSNAVGTSIVLNGPTALLRQSAAIGNTVVTVNGGGTFQVTNGNQSWSSDGQFTGTGAFTIDTTLLAGTNGGLTIGGVSSGGNNSGYTGHITLKTGGGTGFNRVTLTGTTTAFSLGDGTNSNHRLTIEATDTNTALAIGSNANNTTATALTVGTLDGNANARIVATATNNTAIATMTVNQFQTGTYAGTFANSGSGAFRLVKNEAGTLALAGSSSSWTKGAVTVNAGTLLIEADQALGTAAVTVALNAATLASDVSGRTLSNTITTSGSASVIQPAGTLTFGGLNAALGTTLNLDSGEVLNLAGTFTGAASAGGFVLDLTAGFALGTPVSVITFAAQSGLDSSDFVLSESASSLYTLDSVSIDGDSVDITLSAVPEPALCGLVFGGLGLLCAGRRLQQR